MTATELVQELLKLLTKATEWLEYNVTEVYCHIAIWWLWQQEG